MTEHWRDLVREETANAPQGARERVWQAMEDAKAVKRSPLIFAVPVALGAAALAAFMLWPSGLETKTWQTADSVVSVRDGQTSWNAATNELTLTRGEVVASVWGAQPLHIVAHGKSIEVEAATLSVRMAGDSVVIAPTRGFVRVDGERVDATEATRAVAGPLALDAFEPADVVARQAARRAELALEGQRWEEAASALAEVGHSGTLSAEAALVRKGELELRQLKNPTRALATFAELTARFPSGSLEQERELSSLEAEVELVQWAKVQHRAQAFLAKFPTSERRDDVRRVLAASALQQGDRVLGCAQVLELPRGFAADLDAACSRER